MERPFVKKSTLTFAQDILCKIARAFQYSTFAASSQAKGGLIPYPNKYESSVHCFSFFRYRGGWSNYYRSIPNHPKIMKTKYLVSFTNRHNQELIAEKIVEAENKQDAFYQSGGHKIPKNICVSLIAKIKNK